jgi:hypothetical protein
MCSKNTAKRALACHQPPRYERSSSRGWAVDGFEPQIRALLAEFPDMPTAVVMEPSAVGVECGQFAA